MSTTKVFFIFGAIVFIVTFPLIVLYIWFPVLLGRYNNLVENIIVGMIGTFIVALAVDFTLRRRQEKAAEKVARVGLSQASQGINRILELFAYMIKASSDGFIPQTIDELFGNQAAELISLHLGLSSHYPTTSGKTWQEYIAKVARQLQDRLSSVLERYQAFLPGSASAAIGTLQNSSLLSFFEIFPEASRIGRKRGIKYPVFNINQESLKPLMVEIMNSIKTVEKEVKKLNTNVKPRFPKLVFRDDINVGPKFGEARYEGEPGPMADIGPDEKIPW